MCDMIEPDRRERIRFSRFSAAEEVPPERQVFADRERRFQSIAMAEIVRLFGQRQLGIATLQADRSIRHGQQPGQQP